MAPLPGTILAPRDLSVGDLVQARDPTGRWYDAKVVRKTGRGASVSATVRYTGFPARYNEKFRAVHAELRVRISRRALKLERELHAISKHPRVGDRRADGTWPIEKLIKKRRRAGKTEYLTRWAGWAPEHDTWESTNLSKEIVDEFNEETAALARARPPAEGAAAALLLAVVLAHGREPRRLARLELLRDLQVVRAARGQRKGAISWKPFMRGRGSTWHSTDCSTAFRRTAVSHAHCIVQGADRPRAAARGARDHGPRQAADG